MFPEYHVADSESLSPSALLRAEVGVLADAKEVVEGGVGRNGFAVCGGGRAVAFRMNAGRSHASVTQSLLTSDTSRLKDVWGGASPWASAVANCVAVAASA
jgi:hypothetical protein